MSGSHTDRIHALETALAESEARYQQLRADLDRVLGGSAADDRTDRLQAQVDDLGAKLDAVLRRAPARRGATKEGEAPVLQDTAADLAALDAWLVAQTGIGLEYQLQRMCQQFYGNPLMPPS